MLFVYTHISSKRTRYAIRMSVVCTDMSSVCHLYVVMRYSYVFHMYWYVICISLVCTSMSSACRSYVIIYHTRVTRIYSHAIRMSLISTLCHSPVTCMSFYHYPFLNIIETTYFHEYFLFIWELENIFCINLLLPRGLMKPSRVFVLWNKYFEGSSHFISIIFTITLQCCKYSRFTIKFLLPNFFFTH